MRRETSRATAPAEGERAALLGVVLLVGTWAGCSALTGFGDLSFDEPADMGRLDPRMDAGRDGGRSGDAEPGDAPGRDGALVDAARLDGGDAEPIDAGDASLLDAGDASLLDAGDASPADVGPDARRQDTGPVSCVVPGDCEDDDPCTRHDCVDGRCVYTPAPDRTACDDGDACTDEECRDGVCVVTDTVECDATPMGPCDLGMACSPATGACTPVRRPVGASCVSSDRCDDEPTCTADGACTSATQCSRDDGNECTAPLCTGTGCVHAPITGMSCNLGAGTCCNGRCVDLTSDADHCGTCLVACSEGLRCMNGACADCATHADCDDGLSCTTDTCEPTASKCEHEQVADTCLIDAVCYGRDDPNPANQCERCAPGNPTIWTPRTGDPCDDGLVCTAPDRCNAAGVCVGASRSCPGNDCNRGDCVEEGDIGCVLVPVANGTRCGFMLLQECCGGSCVGTIPGC
ncbi:MAG: hypothetical protein IT379_07230 [Deltaproteobacteria bacterium]|nr:hypothetical protein [Deltaproteobacteria bacterium]